jgi:glycosyltransferase involved in cell wall biosynthesis
MKEKIAIFFGADYPKGGGVQGIRDMFKYVQKYEKHLISPGKEKISRDDVFEKIFIVGQHRPGLSIKSLLINVNFTVMAIFCFLKNNRRHRYRKIYVTSPPFFPVLAAAICRKISGVPVVVDVRDPWALGLVLLGVFSEGSSFYKIVSKLEKFGYNASDNVTVVTDGLGKIIEEEFEVPKEKITVIPNAADIEVFKPHQLKPKRIPGIPEKAIVLMYQGGFAVYHELPQLVRVFFEYIEQSGRKDVYLVLVGKKSRVDLEGVIERHAPLRNHLILVGEVPRKEIPYYISAAHIGIVPIKSNEYSQYAMPLKLYEYAACGKPILLFGGTRESKNLIKKYEIGTVSTEKVGIFKIAVETLLKRHETFSKNAIKMSKEINRKNSARLLEEVIDE